MSSVLRIPTGMVFALTLICFHLLSASPLGAQDQPNIGVVKRVQATAQVISGGRETKAVAGIQIRLNDEVRTGTGARLQLTLADNTELTLGANAKLVINRFIYNPDKQNNALSIKVAQGAFRFLSGQISKATGTELRVITQVATIGVRGTDFWGGPIDSTYGVLLLDGAVEVTNPGGTVVLDRPGIGTAIASPTTAPDDPVSWPQNKVDRAIATITFQ